MKREGKSITVKYQTKRHTCHCCDRDLETPKLSEIKEFNFYESDFKDYDGNKWGLYEEVELKVVIEDYAFHTIDFYAVSNHDEIIFIEGELDRIHQFIKDIIIK